MPPCPLVAVTPVNSARLLTDSMMESPIVPPCDELSPAKANHPNDNATVETVEHLTHLLHDVQKRVYAAWAKMGHSLSEQQSKWQSFLQLSLVPFLADFRQLQETEERCSALENEQLMRDIISLSHSLTEPPRHPLLKAVLDDAACHSSHRHASSQNPTPQHQNESALEELQQCGIIVPDPMMTEHRHSLPPSTDGSVSNSPHDNPQGPSVLLPFAADAHEVMMQRALQRLNRTTSHRDANAQLQAELTRLNALAEHRLHLLRLLCTQKQLLCLPAAEQARQRALYAARCVSHPVAGHRESSMASCISAVEWQTEEEGSCYHTALQAMPHTSVPSLVGTAVVKEEPQHPKAPSSTTARELIHDEEGAAATAADSAVGGAPGSAARTAEEELRILLTAAFYGEPTESRRSFLLLPRPTVVEARYSTTRPIEQHPRRNGSEEADGPPQASLFTSTETPRPSEGSTATAANLRTTRPPVEESNRGTLFGADTSDVDRFGKHQDLSMARITREAHDLYHLVVDCNARMASEAQAEMAYLRELVDHSEGLPAELGSDSGVTPNAAELVPPPALEAVQRHLAALESSFEAELGRAEEDAVDEPEAWDGSGEAVEITGSTMAEGSRPSSVRALLVSLPSIVRRLLTALSYAPILHYVQSQRGRWQQYTWDGAHAQWQASVRALEEAQLRLEHHVGGAARQRVLDDVHQRLPPSEPWLPPNFVSVAVDGTTLAESRELWQQAMGAIQRRRDAAHTARQRLQSRLQVVVAVSTLLQTRSSILQMQKALQAGSRERLLSRKVHMAKQLRLEERIRQRVAREVPQLMKKLTELRSAWDALNTESGGLADAPPLFVDGVDVAALLAENNSGESSLSRRPATSAGPTSSTHHRSVTPPRVPSQCRFTPPRNQPQTSPQAERKPAAGPLSLHRHSAVADRRHRDAVKSASPTPAARSRLHMPRTPRAASHPPSGGLRGSSIRSAVHPPSFSQERNVANNTTASADAPPSPSAVNHTPRPRAAAKGEPLRNASRSPIPRSKTASEGRYHPAAQ